ncbi:MAG: DUF2442 domain-containing protein [Caulobacter sp.]|nr:DUF2442 domain-containing protein [Caulobacter sp.]
MKFKLVKARRVSALPGYRLDLTFTDGSSGVADISEFVLSGGTMVRPLVDETYFARVFLEMGVPTWPNGCDIDPTNARMKLEAAGLLKEQGAAA